MKLHYFKHLLLLAFALLLPKEASAYFESYIDGIWLGFEITGPNTVELVQLEEYVNLTGHISIPETIVYETTYTVTSIGESAFSDCTGLTSVTIPNSVTSIGQFAFSNCTNLQTINIPNSVTYIGGDAFWNTAWFELQPDGLIYINQIAYKYKGNMPSGACISINDGTLRIANGCFQYCEQLKSVDFPNSLISIDDAAFYQCKGLTSVTIPNSVESIGGMAFAYCDKLTMVNIPTSLTKIEPGTFYACSSLTSVTIPNSVTSIGSNVFNGCNNLTSVTIPSSVIYMGRNAFDGTAWYNNLPDGLIYINKIAFKYKGSMPNGTSISINDGTLCIAGGCFSDCSGLTSVIIPNSVTIIAEESFKGCSGLTSVTIPSSVTSIGSSAFYGCSGLTSVTIPNSVTEIGNYAFSYCSGLTSVTIPNSVTSIGGYAFEHCSSLTSVTVGGYVTNIGSEIFQSCDSLTTVIIGNIANPMNWSMFWRVPSISALTLVGEGDCLLESPESLPTWFSSKIATLNIGSGITSLGSLNMSPSIVNCFASVPPVCASNTFDSYNGELHVPNGTLVDYALADYWCNFLNLDDDIEQKITISQTSASLVQWNELSLTATVIPASLENEIVWSSTNPLVATVSEDGLVTAVAGGECDIYATIQSQPAVYAKCHVTVTYPEITLTLNQNSLALGYPGNSATLEATVLPNNTGLALQWSTSDSSVATVENGVVTPVGLGECDIVVTCHNKTASCHVTVTSSITLTLSKDNLNLYVNGNAETLTATVNPEYEGLVITWSTTDASVATVDDGIVTPVGEGECDIVATCLDKTATCHVTVIEAQVVITLDMNEMIIAPGTIAYLTPTMEPIETDLTVTTSDITVARAVLLNDRVRVVGINPGTAIITVASVDGKAIPATCLVTVGVLAESITLSENSVSIYEGETLSLTATVLPSDASINTVTWTSSDESIATVDDGVVYAIASGTAIITATADGGNDLSASCEVTVLPGYTSGDVNCDGTIDVADYVDVASYILEQDPQPFVFAAADLDEDNTIDVGDLVGVAYLALNYEGAPMLAAAVGAPEAASIAMDATVNNTASGQYEVAVNLNNNVSLTAMQMDINLPQGMTLVNASLTDRASASHQIEFCELGNGNYRLLAASSALKNFKNNDGAVLTLTLAGSPSGSGKLSNIILASPQAATFKIDDIALDFNPTGVIDVYTDVRIYQEGGNIVIVSPADGEAQLALPNGMYKTVRVDAGRNVYPAPATGLIIVKMGNEVKKMRF